jgi:dihydrolipoamide dehydrogenase
MLSGLTSYLRAGERLRAAGDVNGIWPLTHVGEYEGDVVTANIAGDMRPANYEAVPRVTYTDPQAAAVGAVDAENSATAPVSEVPRAATYTLAYAESKGFVTLLKALRMQIADMPPPARPVDAQTASLSR